MHGRGSDVPEPRFTAAHPRSARTVKLESSRYDALKWLQIAAAESNVE
jgi:hypothetical protein